MVDLVIEFLIMAPDWQLIMIGILLICLLPVIAKL